MVNKFLKSEPTARRTIADLILEKIREKEELERKKNVREKKEYGANTSENPPPKVIEVYTTIGKILSRYKNGKLPKAFKILPALSNWEHLLYLTRPDSWTPQATYAATRLFSSNLSSQMAQKFYHIFLLDKCRADISEHKKLNYHLYQALFKSVYKPAAFFKGIVLPLAYSGDCTLREATIFSSVLSKAAIPANHGAVAILKLSEMSYSGSTSMFLKVLLDKKYALPGRVIDAVAKHFLGFIDEKEELPLLWHQCLLVFVQRYRGSVSKQDKEKFKVLFKVHQHKYLTEEIRRDLFAQDKK